jgi:hypothetical protein
MALSSSSWCPHPRGVVEAGWAGVFAGALVLAFAGVFAGGAVLAFAGVFVLVGAGVRAVVVGPVKAGGRVTWRYAAGYSPGARPFPFVRRLRFPRLRGRFRGRPRLRRWRRHSTPRADSGR